MQVRAASSQFTRWVNQHPACRADDTHQLAFRHHGATSNTSALGDVLHALRNFPGHLYPQGLYLFFFPNTTIAAFMFLHAHDLTTFFIKHQLGALALLLVFLLIR